MFDWNVIFDLFTMPVVFRLVDLVFWLVVAAVVGAGVGARYARS